MKTTLQAIPWGANTPADDAGVGVVDETTRALRRPANWGARVAAAPARPPLLVKIAPDLTEEALVGLVQVRANEPGAGGSGHYGAQQHLARRSALYNRGCA